jgi:hypothetical protein
MIWVIMIISTLLGFCGLADSIVQPGKAYRAAHKSKALWVLLNLVGMLTLVGGAVTWAVYSYGGTRKSVVNKGGYYRPTVGGSMSEQRARKIRAQANAQDRAERIWEEDEKR